MIAFQAALSNQLNAGGKPQIDARTMESAGRLYNRLMEVVVASIVLSVAPAACRRCGVVTVADVGAAIGDADAVVAAATR